MAQTEYKGELWVTPHRNQRSPSGLESLNMRKNHLKVALIWLLLWFWEYCRKKIVIKVKSKSKSELHSYSSSYNPSSDCQWHGVSKSSAHFPVTSCVVWIFVNMHLDNFIPFFHKRLLPSSFNSDTEWTNLVLHERRWNAHSEINFA